MTFAITWRDFRPGRNSGKPHVIVLKFQPGLKSELGHAQWLYFQQNRMAVSQFSPQFQISAQAETSRVIATKFQLGGRAKISARAEICISNRMGPSKIKD